MKNPTTQRKNAGEIVNGLERLGTLVKIRSLANRLPNSLAKWLRIVIAVGLLSFILSRIGLQPVAQSFSNVVWFWIVAKVLLGLVGLVLVTIRWKILLAAQGINLPTSLLLKRFWISRFVNNFLPGETGGDLFRIFGHWGLPLKTSAVAGSVAIDRLTGMIGLLAFVSVTGLVEFSLARELGLRLLPAISLLLAVALLALVTVRGPNHWVQSLVTRWVSTRLRTIEEYIDCIFVYVDKRDTILRAVIISLAYRLVAVIGVYFGFRALGVDISFGNVMFISSVIQLITILPVSINAWGIREGAFVLLFSQVGVGNAEALSVALLGRMLSTLQSSVGAILYMTRR